MSVSILKMVLKISLDFRTSCLGAASFAFEPHRWCFPCLYPCCYRTPHLVLVSLNGHFAYLSCLTYLHVCVRKYTYRTCLKLFLHFSSPSVAIFETHRVYRSIVCWKCSTETICYLAGKFRDELLLRFSIQYYRSTS